MLPGGVCEFGPHHRAGGRWMARDRAARKRFCAAGSRGPLRLLFTTSRSWLARPIDLTRPAWHNQADVVSGLRITMQMALDEACSGTRRRLGKSGRCWSTLIRNGSGTPCPTAAL